MALGSRLELRKMPSTEEEGGNVLYTYIIYVTA